MYAILSKSPYTCYTENILHIVLQYFILFLVYCTCINEMVEMMQKVHLTDKNSIYYNILQ